MATATAPKMTSFDHDDTQRRVRHPLQLVRKYIRRYVILEGMALTLLFVSLVFWLGAAFDFGLASLDVEFLTNRLIQTLPEETPAWLVNDDPADLGVLNRIATINIHGVDWVQELNDVDTTGFSSRGVRIVLLTVIIVGLLVLGIMKVVVRWVREFNDRAVALVLERRFPKELGDRLITAVELADPTLSKKYGYSQAMLEKTILEAVATLKKLPVASVFNWRRLAGLWFLAGLASFGILFVTMIVFGVGSLIFANENERTIDPVTFGWKFCDAAAICTERNVLMMNTYWPRRAHLEIARFQPSKEPGKENEMRVAKDDARPELQVRAIEWVIADRNAPSGWRALTWKDLSERNLVDKELLDGVKVPVEFKHWKVDPEELEPNLVAALFGTETQTRSSAELRAYFAQAKIARKIAERDEKENLARWLDWHNWTMDKIGLQKENNFVKADLASLRRAKGESEGEDLRNLKRIFERLGELALEPMMSRTLRRLEVPGQVEITFRGAELSTREMPQREEGNKFTIPLDSLKEATHFKFRARGEDFFTAPKVIALVPAPQPAEIFIDKQEPAYIYHRLVDLDQRPLRGMKHTTVKFPLSTTGDLNTIELPLGSNLVIHVRTDRKLHAEKPVFPKETGSILDPGYVGYLGGAPAIDADGQGFRLSLNDVTKNQEFIVEFFDEDNIRGKRRFRIQRNLDMEPQLTPLSISEVILRKPRFKVSQQPQTIEKEKEKDHAPSRDQSELMNAFLITPDAYIPFECNVKDDYGLVRAGWHYKLRKVDFDFSSTGSKRSGNVQAEQIANRIRAAILLSNMQFRPDNPLSVRLAPFHVALTSEILLKELRASQGYREAYVPSEAFEELLERERRKGRMRTLDGVKKNLAKPANIQPMEFDFKDDRKGFDVQRYIRDLKTIDLDKSIQLHYLLQVSVQATDNKVEKEKYVDEHGIVQERGPEYDVFVRADNENVEVGPVVFNDKGESVYIDDQGRSHKVILREKLSGNTKRNKNGYISFLIVSENELLAQIALEEELVSERLEGAKERLDAAITSLEAQRDKIRDGVPPGMELSRYMETLNFRMNEIRTVIGSAGVELRAAEQAYRNIMKEMDVNRVRSDRKDKIADAIYYPIKRIIERNERDKGSGSFPDAEDAFQRSIQLVEDDKAAERTPKFNDHRPLIIEADREMRRLSQDMNRVLIAMQDGISEAKLLALLAGIERGHGQTTKKLEELYIEAVKRTIDELFKDKKEKTPPMPEKKTSSLRGGGVAPTQMPWADVAAWSENRATPAAYRRPSFEEWLSLRSPWRKLAGQSGR